jgi:hypothetical protein
MRIRQVKPSFWTDSTLAELREPVRLFYIGLWMLADDAGWFRVNVPEIGNELYGFDSRKARETKVAAYLDLLKDAKRITVEECGHALVVKLRDHQHLAGSTKQVTTVQREHSRCAPPDPAGPRKDPPTPAPVSKGLGKVRNGSVGQGQEDARAHEEETTGGLKARLGEFRDVVGRPS